MKKSVLLAILGSFICGNSFAGAPKLLGQWDDWAAYFYEDSAGRVCYMASTPKKDEGKYTKRGDIYAVVTHRPKEKSFDVFNIKALTELAVSTNVRTFAVESVTEIT